MSRPKRASTQKTEEIQAKESVAKVSNVADKTEGVKEVKATKEPVSKEEAVDDLDVSSAKENSEQVKYIYILNCIFFFIDINIQPTKRKRGRPANTSVTKKQKVIDPSIPKRGRGRPKKIITAA